MFRPKLVEAEKNGKYEKLKKVEKHLHIKKL